MVQVLHWTLCWSMCATSTNFDSSHVVKVQSTLSFFFKLKILDSLKYFLGSKTIKSNKGVSLSHKKYALSLFDNIGFLDSKPTTLPMDPNLKLNLNDGTILRIPLFVYRTLIRRFVYLTIFIPKITLQFTCLVSARRIHALHI